MELHNKMMNIPCTVPADVEKFDAALAYKLGHRDARHAAAELVIRDEIATLTAEGCESCIGTYFLLGEICRSCGHQAESQGIKKARA